jgi:hypothetical protein
MENAKTFFLENGQYIFITSFNLLELIIASSPHEEEYRGEEEYIITIFPF